MDCYGVDYNILTVVTCKVAENIKEIYADYKKRGWNYQQYIACLDPLGEERGNRKYALTPEAYGKFLIELFELWYFDWKKKCQPYIRQFDNYVGILMGYQPESCEQRGKCGIQTFFFQPVFCRRQGDLLFLIIFQPLTDAGLLQCMKSCIIAHAIGNGHKDQCGIILMNPHICPFYILLCDLHPVLVP